MVCPNFYYARHHRLENRLFHTERNFGNQTKFIMLCFPSMICFPSADILHVTFSQHDMGTHVLHRTPCICVRYRTAWRMCMSELTLHGKWGMI